MFLFIPFLTLTDMPEVTHSPMPSISDEEDGLNYSVHIQSAAEGSSSKPGRLQALGDLPRKRQSIPIRSVQSSMADKSAFKTSLSSATGLKIKTEVEVHAQDEGSTSRPAKPPPSQRKTPSCTVSKAPEDNVSSHVVPISQKRFYPKSTASSASTRKNNTYSPEVSDCETVSVPTFLRDDDVERPQKDDKKEIDPAIKEKVYIGLNQVKEDWKRHSSKIYKKKWCA